MNKNIFIKIWHKLNRIPRDHMSDIYHNEVDRPYYGYCIFKAAKEAIMLGYNKISIIEFGVAGGNGLVNIEYHCKKFKETVNSNFEFEIYGFDLEIGLPEPKDYRDIPHSWSAGWHKMDRKKLEEKLDNAKLIIGDVAETTKTFFEQNKPAPIGVIFFDVDYYSSTMNCFNILDTEDNNLLPRIYCFFDDLHTIEYVAGRAAINDFNTNNKMRKFAKAPEKRRIQNIYLSYGLYEFHNFKHKDYIKKLIPSLDKQMPLKGN